MRVYEDVSEFLWKLSKLHINVTTQKLLIVSSMTQLIHDNLPAMFKTYRAAKTRDEVRHSVSHLR